ncbi:hypothetical protein, partial [Metabacillus niabensis]|uniref:hypothetical protein n=1 Tax=Metabacillus niabensis TaxID=324854 RepID=UPI001CFABE02
MTRIIGICIRHNSLISLTTIRINKFFEYHPNEQVDFICFHWNHLNTKKREVIGLKFNKNKKV